MLFSKKIPPRCAYCDYGKAISEREVACIKHGVVGAAHSCRSFFYDPLKRVPPRPARVRKQGLTPEDFSIE